MRVRSICQPDPRSQAPVLRGANTGKVYVILGALPLVLLELKSKGTRFLAFDLYLAAYDLDAPLRRQ
jgi:hypothetical protein